MQLSEVSELQCLVSLMRLNACNSPRFHDRQDSEVDRIYNSSPKVATSDLRTSWMERPWQNNMQTQNSSNATLSMANNENGQPENDSDHTSNTTQKQTNGRNGTINGVDKKEKRTNGTNTQNGGKPKVVVFEKIQPKNPNKNASSGSDVVLNSEQSVAEEPEKVNNTTFAFEKESVTPVEVSKNSLLELALRGTSSGPKLPMPNGAADSAILHLKIYLPNRDEMSIDVSTL